MLGFFLLRTRESIHSSRRSVPSFLHIEGITLGESEEIYEIVKSAYGIALDCRLIRLITELIKD
jgi:hypothetical protein